MTGPQCRRTERAPRLFKEPALTGAGNVILPATAGPLPAATSGAFPQSPLDPLQERSMKGTFMPLPIAGTRGQEETAALGARGGSRADGREATSLR